MSLSNIYVALDLFIQLFIHSYKPSLNGIRLTKHPSLTNTQSSLCTTNAYNCMYSPLEDETKDKPKTIGLTLQQRVNNETTAVPMD